MYCQTVLMYSHLFSFGCSVVQIVATLLITACHEPAPLQTVTAIASMPYMLKPLHQFIGDLLMPRGCMLIVMLMFLVWCRWLSGRLVSCR